MNQILAYAFRRDIERTGFIGFKKRDILEIALKCSAFGASYRKSIKKHGPLIQRLKVGKRYFITDSSYARTDCYAKERCYAASSYHVLILLLIIALVILMTNFYEITVQEALGSSSPFFQRQEITLDRGNWFDRYNNKSSSGPDYIDIESVSYYSDGRHLNATLWLHNFTMAPPTDYDNVNYGMYIDADSNNRTGSGGIDYKVEVNWNSSRRTWERLFEEWSSSEKSKPLSPNENVTDFFGEDGSYVTLYADLSSMLSPDNYRVIFYAEVINDPDNLLKWIIDSTGWISIPSPELTLEVSPSTIPLTQGGNSVAELRINSSSADGLDIHLGHPTVHGTNTTDVNITLGSEELHIPPFGVTSTQLRASVPFGIETPAAYMISIPVTITPVFSPLNLFGSAVTSPSEGESSSSDQTNSPEKGKKVAGAASDETISKSVAFSVQVMAFDEQLKSFIDQWVTPLTALYASISSIIGGILAWIYKRSRRRKSKKDDQDNKDKSSNNTKQKDHSDK